MPGLMFLYGDQHNSAGETVRPFLDAAGGEDARIAMLTEGGEKSLPYSSGISAPWQSRGIEAIHIGPPQHGGEANDDMAQKLKSCSGIYMCGGDTRVYRRLYVQSYLGGLLREMHAAGVPYAGVSAGVILAAERCAIWGGIVSSPSNEYYVRYKGAYDGAEGDISLQLGQGLGLFAESAIEPHFSEVGGFPRLLTVMEQTGMGQGFGLDAPICLVVDGGKPKRVLGRGRLYHVLQTERGRFSVRVYEPGETVPAHTG